jgi:hypothetical protein
LELLAPPRVGELGMGVDSALVAGNLSEGIAGRALGEPGDSRGDARDGEPDTLGRGLADLARSLIHMNVRNAQQKN